jgi:hypothetical protein
MDTVIANTFFEIVTKLQYLEITVVGERMGVEHWWSYTAGENGVA